MEFKNCRVCRTVFSSDDSAVCARCAEGSDKTDYQKVREYLYANRGATILQVEAATGVSRSIIREYINYGKVELVNPTKKPNY